MMATARARQSSVAAALVIAVVALAGLSGPPALAASPAIAPTAAATSADRIAGPDRYATAVSVSTAAFAPGVERVFLASGADYPDALSAAPIAAALGAPLLLTSPTALPAVVATELRRLAPTVEVVIVGGLGVVSAAVEARVTQLGFTVVRVQGANRYATSRAMIERSAPPSTTLYLATGRNYPDALAAAAAAGSAGAPVMLVDGALSALDDATLQLIAAREVDQVLIAGGTGVVSTAIEQQLASLGYAVQRLAGADRYATAVAINTFAFPTATRAFVATGVGFADALAGAVYAGIESAPLYSSSPFCVPRSTRVDIVDRLQASRVTLLGGTGVLGPAVQAMQSCSTADDDRRTSEAELTAALQQRLRTLPGTYSVSVRQLEGLQASVSIRGAVAQEPVSVIKVFVAYAVLDRIERGLASFTTPTRSGVSVGECLRVMIHVSDNYCHHDLVALLGVSSLSAQLRAEGYSATVYSGAASGTVPYSSKLSSTDDLALLLSRLKRGELLNPELTAHFMTLLETQLWRSKIPSGVEAGVPVANKTGSAWTAAGWFHSDAGIVSAPSGPYVIAVLGGGGASVTGVREISRIVYEHFNDTLVTAGTFSDLNVITAGPTSYFAAASANTLLGTIPAGTVVAVDVSERTWYRVIYNGTGVFVHSSALRNAVDYPRSP
jgi:putative cell wall-binding protein